jgi:hypothetical protein
MKYCHLVRLFNTTIFVAPLRILAWHFFWLFMFLLNACSNQGDANGDDESTPIVGLETHRTAGQTFPEQGADEQAISEAALNKIIGTAETYDLKVTIEVHFCFHSYSDYTICMGSNVPFIYLCMWAK